MPDARISGGTKRALLPNSLELPYVEQGDVSGTPVVFLHAYADSWRSFEVVLGHLPSSIHAYVPTQRGHGDADKPRLGYEVNDFAGDLAAFLDVLGLKRTVLVASSSATFTVQRFTVDNPHRVLGLMLIGAPWSIGDTSAASALAEGVFSLGDPVDPAFVRDFVESTVMQRRVSPAFLEVLIEESLKVPAHVWTSTLRGLLDARPPAETAVIARPTLIVWGDRDDFVSRADQEKLLAAIPAAQLVIYEGTGHMVHWENPKRVAAEVAAFAEELRP
jgi:pimeloyl-ACP methyl ester carboxylesterase